ncbi:uncharacterized protein LOC123560839 [Mercenaria mercenaria]|uniref:uncharacterized protein LOC123560839 n=1 Tax=Mercenaria mercenaria TaxID=6596 RepID=UPI00234F8F5B|nr:uncharacterized protein LOC123560839 [Mercenaria mercenaria]
MYFVTWPWKEENPELPENRHLAFSRLKSNIARMKNKPEILEKYNTVIQEQLSKGVIEKVDNNTKNGTIHYIPHHAVITPQKTTTKLRVVYDASAKVRKENKSLNECLYRGPVILSDLCGLLMRFRLHKVAVVSDIEKAFLQIGLQENQRDVTRFLWIRDIKRPFVNKENVQEYRFCRVPFGVISSPFLLGATIESHLESYNNSIANKIKDDIYVDNVITGTDTWQEALDLYSRKFDWDDPLEEIDILDTWSSVKKNLEEITAFTFSRSMAVYTCRQNTEYTLLCFCDASADAYATSIYLHQKGESDTQVNLVFAKSRLAPLKEITIPRLELMAVLIGVRCLKFVRDQLKLDIKNMYVWTDSQCVIQWIKSYKDLPIFVRNRVSEIKADEKIKFEYISGDQNPADVASRGCSLTKLSVFELWWNGPWWLHEQESTWLKHSGNVCERNSCAKEEINDSENVMIQISTRENKNSCVFSSPFEIDSEKYSSVTKMLRVTALALRFIQKIRKLPYTNGSLKSSEMKTAEEMWLLHVQRKHFADEFESIRSAKKNNLQQQLGLYIDEVGLLRCKGRLENADISENAKHPVLLPRKDRLTYLFIDKIHKEILHSGVSQTLAKTRQRFWIPHGRATIKSVLHMCTVCRRFDGGPYKMPPMPSLPPSRVTECRPFSRTGLDYLGPIYVKSNDTPKKVWVCLFTCLVTRAVHLEVVLDMSTEEFLMCLRRFISQRGTPVQLISDNGSHFKAASSILDRIWNRTLHSDEVQTYASNSRITWNFITELAPWMGGYYERLCDTCNKYYKNMRNLKRHIKEKHTAIEFWNCTENNCSSKFIRRSYLSKHLILTHKHDAATAREKACCALRGDIKEHGYYEEISDDESIFSLLAEQNGELQERDFVGTVSDYNLSLLQADTHVDNKENNDETDMCSNHDESEVNELLVDKIEKECHHGESEVIVQSVSDSVDTEELGQQINNDNTFQKMDADELDYSDISSVTEDVRDVTSTNNNDVISETDNKIDNVVESDDVNSVRDVISRSDDAITSDSDINESDDCIVIEERSYGDISENSADEYLKEEEISTALVPSNVTTRTQTLILTFTKKTYYIGDEEVDSVITAEQEYIDDFE